MAKLKALAVKLGKEIEDLSELNVRTFSGDLSVSIKGLVDEDLQDLDVLLKKGVVAGNISLEASSVLKIDGDIDNIYSAGISKEMKQIHQDSIDAGKEYRKAIVDFVKEL